MCKCLSQQNFSSNWKPGWLGIWQGWWPAGAKYFLQAMGNV
jgi:hypothetical protein